MVKKKPSHSSIMARALERDYPEYDKTFHESVWDGFDFDAVVEILTSKKQSFPYHKQILLSALGAWVIAPDQDDVRRSVILTNVRLALAQAERKILKYPADQRYIQDLLWRIGGTGPRFMQDIYYPIGGIKALASEKSEQDARDYLKNTFKRRIVEFSKFFQIVHIESQTDRDRSTFLPISLNRTYTCMSNFNGEIGRYNKTLIERGSQKKALYWDAKSLEEQIKHCKYRLALMYAAQFVQISDEHTLLDRFLNPYVRCPASVRRKALQRWLGISAYLFEDVLLKLGSRNLLPDCDHKVLQVTQIPIEPVPLEPWEAEQVKRGMMKTKALKAYDTSPKAT